MFNLSVFLDLLNISEVIPSSMSLIIVVLITMVITYLLISKKIVKIRCVTDYLMVIACVAWELRVCV